MGDRLRRCIGNEIGGCKRRTGGLLLRIEGPSRLITTARGGGAGEGSRNRRDAGRGASWLISMQLRDEILDDRLEAVPSG